MRRQERRRKFHEAVLNTLYPPPQPEDEEKPITTLGEGFDVELINPDDFGEERSYSTDDDGGGESDGEHDAQKLTRAQRKRLRKSKLKEEASRRGRMGIIGPLLPSSTAHDAHFNAGGSGAAGNEPPGVRQNVVEELEPLSLIDKPGEPPGGNSWNKLKCRRMAKRLSRERMKSTGIEGSNQDQSFKPTTFENCDEDHHPSRRE